MRITEQRIDHYREHGFVIIENFLTREELSRSYDDIEQFAPAGTAHF